MLATVSAAISLGEQPRKRRIALLPDNNAAAGASIKAPPRAPATLALIESSLGYGAQPSASCWMEGVSSEANPADAPSRNKLLFKKPDVTG